MRASRSTPLIGDDSDQDIYGHVYFIPKANPEYKASTERFQYFAMGPAHGQTGPRAGARANEPGPMGPGPWAMELGPWAKGTGSLGPWDRAPGTVGTGPMGPWARGTGGGLDE